MVRSANAAWNTSDTLRAPSPAQQPQPQQRALASSSRSRSPRPKGPRTPGRAAGPTAAASPSTKRRARSPAGPRPTSIGAKGRPGKTVANALATRGSQPLTEVDLADIRLTDADIVAVARHATSFNAPYLRTVVLSNCHVGAAGVQKLIDGLVFTNLTTLRLDNNGIGDAGAVALAMCLGSTSKLSTLHLQGNRIADTGGSALARALVANCSLEALYLRENAMGEDSGIVFASVLSHHNRTLCVLDGLEENTPGVRDLGTRQRLSQALQRNRRQQMAGELTQSQNQPGISARQYSAAYDRMMESLGGQSSNAAAPLPFTAPIGQHYQQPQPPQPPQQYQQQQPVHHATVTMLSDSEDDSENNDDEEHVAEISSHTVSSGATSGLSDAELALFKRIQAADTTPSSEATVVNIDDEDDDAEDDDGFEAEVVGMAAHGGGGGGKSQPLAPQPQLAPEPEVAEDSESAYDAVAPASAGAVGGGPYVEEIEDADIDAARDAVSEAAEAFAKMHGFAYVKPGSTATGGGGGASSYADDEDDDMHDLVAPLATSADVGGVSPTGTVDVNVRETTPNVEEKFSPGGPARAPSMRSAGGAPMDAATTSTSALDLLESSLQELSTGFRLPSGTGGSSISVGFHDELSTSDDDFGAHAVLGGGGTGTGSGSTASRAQSIEQALEEARQVLLTYM